MGTIKKVIYFIGLVAGSFVSAQTLVLVDTNFRNCLNKRYPATLNTNNELILSEAAKLSGALSCNSAKISNLEGIQYFSGIDRLEMAGNALTVLPAISNLKQVSYMDFSENQLVYFPEVSQLLHLKGLILKRNKLRFLPDISQNDSLEVLNSHTNLLDTLPDLSRLKKLKELNLVHNQLRYIPNLDKLTALESLICWENQIRALPSLVNLSKLVTLDIAENQLSVAPTLAPKSKIKKMLLNDNQITVLQDYSGMDSLNRINLFNNQLTFSELLKLTPIKGYDTLVFANPQKTLKCGTNESYIERESIKLSTGVDRGIKGIKYDWYKNGILFRSTPTDSLVITQASLTDSGKYHCLISHPTFANFSLQTDTFKVHVSPCLYLDNLSTSITGINCLREGTLSITGIKPLEQISSYILKGIVSGKTISSETGQFKNLSETTYALTVRTKSLCEKTYISKIEIPHDECKEAYMTPNGDGESDNIFFPQKGQVTIFDKRGKIIKTMNIPAEWDGTQTNGRVPQGYYTAEINQGEELINISVMY